MADLPPLSVSRLHRAQAPEELGFESTAELADPQGPLGQQRAQDALEFGASVRGMGFNLFVLGQPGSGRHHLVRRVLDARAAAGPAPSDWVYVHCFDEPDKPRALSLPGGRGAKLRDAMLHLIEELQVAIPAAFESDEYRNRRQLLEQKLEARPEEAFHTLSTHAEAHGLRLLRTPQGFAFAPTKGGEVITPEQFNHWPESAQEQVRGEMTTMENELTLLMSEVPKWQREARHALRELDREIAGFTANDLLREVVEAFADLEPVRLWLEELRKDLVDHAHELKDGEEAPAPSPLARRMPQSEGFLERYRVNLLVDRGGDHSAPVVYEDEPRLQALLGRVDQRAFMGMFMSDFTLIRAGALHRANGGYLVLDALRVLVSPGVWDALKRALRAEEIRISSLAETLGMVSAAGLEPQPIPLHVKVVLIGDRRIYYQLAALDTDFAELFKIAADFDDELPWDLAHAQGMARLLGSIARGDGLLPLHRSAVARVVEEAARTAGDQAKLSADVRALADLVREADWLARREGRERIEAPDVEAAIEARERRESRARELTLERFSDGTVLLETRGAVIGQINGLSVLSLGALMFGQPSRITCRVRLGHGEVIDIEREVELGGPIHSKGVMILSGYLGAHYALEHPLSLAASLVFEQSYGGVDGDSASLAELCSLLSALAEAPIEQRFAVTGSINQMGEVQPIGGVNAKIEGFFEVCRQAGLDGSHAVIIPASNERHTMLRAPVLEAVRDGKFKVYSVRRVDEAIALLTGVPAGEKDANGRYPETSVHGRVEKRLAALAEKARAFASERGGRP